MVNIFKYIFILTIYFTAISVCEANVDQRIINGKDATKSEFPWIINMVNKGSSTHRCGGVLIHKDWVLTAGHCVTDINASQIQLIAGDHNRTDSDSSKQRRDVDDFVVHPNYEPDSGLNFNNKTHDFALVKVSFPFQFTESVKIINLPQSINSSFAVSGDMTLAGWGLTNFQNKTVPDILQKLNLTIIPLPRCRQLYSYRDVEITDQMFCAGDQWSSPCNGDSGTGFVEITRDPISNCKIHVLYGIVSFGSSGCNGGTVIPAIFGYVPSIIDWIEETINANVPIIPTNTTCGIEDSDDSDGGNSSNTLNINSKILLCALGMYVLLIN